MSKKLKRYSISEVAIGLAIILLLFFANKIYAKDSLIPIAGGELRISYSGEFSRAEKDKVERWMAEMTDAVETIYGQFPLRNPHVRITRSYSWRGPVPWGQINRPANSRVDLHLNPSFSYQTIRDDWTAVHELSHLLLPYAGSRGSWFSEGLASYYQNIARGNAGLLSEQQTWQKLYEGFRRGERNTHRRQMPLYEAAENRYGNTMRIYWTGAVYFLLVDIELRERSQGRQSLATVLAQYRDCCLPNHSVMPVTRIIAMLDRLSKTDVFSKHYRFIIDSKDFPDYQEAFSKLGIETLWGNVRFSKDLTKQRLRRQIVTSN